MKNCNNCDYYVYDPQSGFCLCIHNENGNGYIRDAEHHACEKYKGKWDWTDMIGEKEMSFKSKFEPYGIIQMCGNCAHLDRSIVLTCYPPKARCTLCNKAVYFDQRECVAEDEQQAERQ